MINRRIIARANKEAHGTAWKSGERTCGAVATELAILLPFLALAFGAALDFGRIFYTTQTLENCAYVGALYASGNTHISSSTTTASATAITAAVVEGAPLPMAIHRIRSPGTCRRLQGPFPANPARPK